MLCLRAQREYALTMMKMFCFPCVGVISALLAGRKNLEKCIHHPDLPTCGEKVHM